MAQTTLVPPDSHTKAATTRDENAESGWSFKRIIEAINTMFAELYASAGSAAAALAAFTVSEAAVTLDRPITVPTYTVATAPDAEDAGTGAMIYVSDGSAGSACLAVSDGTDWKVVALGSTIAAE